MRSALLVALFAMQYYAYLGHRVALASCQYISRSLPSQNQKNQVTTVKIVATTVLIHLCLCRINILYIFSANLILHICK